MSEIETAAKSSVKALFGGFANGTAQRALKPIEVVAAIAATVEVWKLSRNSYTGEETPALASFKAVATQVRAAIDAITGPVA